MADTTPLAPPDAEIVALMGDPRYSTIGAVREAISRWGAQPTPSSAAEFALQALVAAGHVSQELVDRALALPGAPQPVEREPLTDERIRSMCAQPWVFDTVKQWVRITEAAHGIKGGQQ